MAHGGRGSASPSYSPFNNNSPIPPPPPPSSQLHHHHHHQQQQQHLQQHYARSPVALGSPQSPYQAGLLPVGQQHQPAASPPMATMRGPSGRVVEYNPQQWGQSGPTGVAISHAALAGAGGAPRDPDVGECLFFFLY
jgi:hypothetical protein